MDLDVAISTREVARTTTHLLKLLPHRPFDPVLAGAVLDAHEKGLTPSATDRERSIRLSTTARCTAGAVRWFRYGRSRKRRATWRSRKRG